MLTSRSGSQGSSTAPPPQSIEVIRRRARHRLIGAAVLVLLGVLGFPMLFDTQPRPIAGDIPIEIPARNPAQPLSSTKTPGPQTHAPAPVPAPAAAVASVQADKSPSPVGTLPASEGLDAREEVVSAAAQESAAPKAKEPPQTEAKVAPQPEPRTEVSAEAARAQALLNDKPEAAGLRLVVQVGAFAEVARARETRLKLERAGLKTYTHVAETPQGKRIRVRLGPFATRAEADKAAARVKALGLPAAILTL